MNKIKIVAINSVNYGSTGNTMFDIAKYCRENNFEYYTYSGSSPKYEKKDHILFGNKYERYINTKITLFTGYDCAALSSGTNKLISDLKLIRPDIIHLHNLHGSYINYVKLFKYIKDSNIKVVWTLHDCWSFTGKCPHFTAIECYKWKDKCFDCKQLDIYPRSMVDLTSTMYKVKKDTFANLDNISIVVVSNWLKKICKESFLNKHNTYVIENGINLDKFKASNNTALKEKYNIKDKFIILGVASPWTERKGINDFIKLSQILDSNYYKIVLIGMSKEQIREFSKYNILGLEKTDSVEELIEWYSLSDVLFNPSIEETFGLVTVEAMACGTPVIVYNSTASPELIENTLGYCIEPHDICRVKEAIHEIKSKGKKYYSYDMVSKVNKYYSKQKQLEKYKQLYENLMNSV
ncbi:glycosyltransferase [Paraclostridium bifermentans]|uniref:glycosyltransferase n=1 Tax=Paraclostridium bifermentans TaxID=1490 RepID=UPI001FF1C826|nr:glycosyltransferase [Paraclostridium bifermentans]UOW67240.1 glycosyltransferase [Paraclostridium bifermentans]